MALRPDDPVYYKVKLTQLLQKAVDNGITVLAKEGFIAFADKTTGEMASVDVAIRRDKQ